MATTSPVYEDRDVSIGRVFQRAFSAIASNPVVFLGLALVVGALPGLLMSYLIARSGVAPTDAAAAGAVPTAGVLWAMMFSSLLGLVIAALVQGALTRATVSAAEGRRASFGESLSTGLRVFLPLIGLSILFALGVGLGFVLLIVPGVILLLMWAVAVPTLVVERGGVFAAFSRSRQLTRGSRWKILGLFIVLVVIYWLLSALLGLVGMSVLNPGTTEPITAVTLIGSVIMGTIFNVLWGTIQPSLYVELRNAKEGGSLENLEEVFA